MPFSWAASSPSAICRTIATTCAGSSFPRLLISALRLVPSSSSITMNVLPSSSPTSWMSMMLGWPMALAACASRTNRATMSLSSAYSGLSIFTATRLWMTVCSAS